MLQNIGLSGFLLIATFALILFGPDKLPQIGRSLGLTIKAFKEGMQDNKPEAEQIAAEEQKLKASDKPDTRRLPD